MSGGIDTFEQMVFALPPDRESVMIRMMPKPAPRPRAYVVRQGRKHVARVKTPQDYIDIKDLLANEIRERKVPPAEWTHIAILHAFPYPKGVAKKRRTERPQLSNVPKGDVADNLNKIVLDALQDAGVIKDDKQIVLCISAKARHHEPFISFTLAKRDNVTYL